MCIRVASIEQGQSPKKKSPSGKRDNFIHVSTRGLFTCAVSDAGYVNCFGDNTDGAAPDYRESTTAEDFVTVTAGETHTCAYTTSGDVQCWGRNNKGQAPPDHLATEGAWLSVSAGDAHSCAVSEWGYVQCWGDNEEGQTHKGRERTPGDRSTYTQVSCGDAHT